jgi:2-methylisocitrate lyase-like PEP mutase family enzyme
MPCCYDGLTARLVEDAGFELTFMTGFGVSAVNGLPDTGLITAEEMSRAALTITSSLRSTLCIGDGDTGYGNEANVMRTVKRYAQMGLAGIMIEDQVSPKRCGHTKGKQVVDRDEARRRVQAAVQARNAGADIVILARTDARIVSLQEAIERCQMFMELGADWTFLEAPHSVEEMKEYCQRVPGPKLANMLEGGKTPILSKQELEAIGYKVAAYPLTLLSAATKAYKDALHRISHGESTEHPAMGVSFGDLQKAVGFPEYYSTMESFGKE